VIPALRVPNIPGIHHLRAARALEKAAVHIVRQGKHMVITGGRCILTIPRHDPVKLKVSITPRTDC
jgi:hypothetical protein